MSLDLEVNEAMELARGEGLNIVYHELRIGGHEFVGYTQFQLFLKKHGQEKKLTLNVFPTFETKYRLSECRGRFAEKVQLEIRRFWNSSDEQLEYTANIL